NRVRLPATVVASEDSCREARIKGKIDDVYAVGLRHAVKLKDPEESMRGLTLVDGQRAVTLAGGDEVASSLGQVVHRQPFYVCRQAVFAHGGNFRPLSTILR